MAVVVTLTDVVVDPDGKYRIRFADGTELEFANLAELQAYGSDFDSPGGDGPANAQLLALRWWLARSPNASNVNLVEGKTITLDLGAANIFRVQ